MAVLRALKRRVANLFAYAPSRRTLALLGCLACTVTSHAVQQGATGPATSGDIGITLTSGLVARITGLSDMSLGTWGGMGSGPLTANDNVCIGQTGVGFFASGNYRIVASGDGVSGDPNAFSLSNGAHQMSYDVYFNDQPNAGTGRTQMTAGVALTNQTGTGFQFVFNLFGCSFENANVSIEVPESELATGNGTYSGTLTLVLIPD